MSLLKRFRLSLALALFASVTAGACNCDTYNVGGLHDTHVTILSPADGATVGPTVHFSAKATGSTGVQSLALYVGPYTGSPDQIANCQPASAQTEIDCAKDFSVAAEIAQEENDSLTLTAVARDASNAVTTAQVTVLPPGLTVKFDAPPLTQHNPPIAAVRGTSALTLEVSSLVAVSSVEVMVDHGTQPLASWSQPSGAQPMLLNKTVDWDSLGKGPHKLAATATDVNGDRTETDLQIVDGCAQDGDCPSGERCCTADGSCNPTVGQGAECSCDKPCSTDEGCFPGTCGTLPAKCRPGCFPGSWDPAPNGTAADTCSPQPQGGQNVAAYCTALPPGEVTAANKGGGCAPGDNCQVVPNNCPDAALNRNSPLNAQTNPLVHYTCTPMSPAVNACIPAGAVPVGGACTESCDSIQHSCAPGLLCAVDQSGQAKCAIQCTDPDRSDAPDCPNGEACVALYGPGNVEYATGTCAAPR